MELQDIKLSLKQVQSNKGLKVAAAQKELLLKDLPDVKGLIKKRLLTTQDADFLIRKLNDRKYMYLEALDVAEQIKAAVPPERLVPFLQAYTNLIKTIHGENIKIDISGNIDVNQHEQLVSRPCTIIDVEEIKAYQDKP